MSVEAMGQAWKSDYKAAQLVVLLAIGDVVNDAHGNEFYMTVASLAEKAKVSRGYAKDCLVRFVADGWLETLTESRGRVPARYRFLGQPATERRVGATRDSGPTRDSAEGQPATLTTPTRDSGEPSPITNPREPNELQPSARAALVPAADPFDAMWSAYPPRRGGKQAARKAWDRTVKAGADPAALLAAVGHYATCRTAWGQAEARFTKHAATFFGPDRHWEDWVAGVPAGEMPVRKESRGERDLRFLNERRAARRAEPAMMRELLP